MPVAIDVRRELEMVAKLQSIDTQLMELEEEKGDLPKLVQRLKDTIRKREDDLASLRSRTAEIGHERRALDGQVQLAKMKQQKYKEQLYRVSTNREYDAITHEIENIRLQLEESDNAQLALLEEEDKLFFAASSIEAELRSLQAELAERGAELEAKEEETRQEDLELHHQREKLAVRIKKPIMAHYERIREAKDGIGAAHLYASACSCCFAVVPPQRQAEVRKMDDIILCESCGVILLPETEYMNI